MPPSILHPATKATTDDRDTSSTGAPDASAENLGAIVPPVNSTPLNENTMPSNITRPTGNNTGGTPKRAAPPLRKRKVIPPSSSGDSDSADGYSPPKKVPKVAAAKTTPTRKRAAAPAPPTPAPSRPRGRPPGGGIPRKTPRPATAASTTDVHLKAEYSPNGDNPRRAKPKTANDKPAEAWSVAPSSNRRFTSDDLGLLETGMFADATIIGIKREWKVHKTILCTRSKWFANAFNGDQADGQTNVVNLTSFEAKDVETLLKFIYSGSLDKEEYKLENGSFLTYARLFNLGEIFDLESLSNDALTLSGQYCDQKLAEICSYDVANSGRHGTIDPIQNTPDRYIDDLLHGIWVSYEGIEGTTRLQALLASFVWAGRDRLLRCEGFSALADRCPLFCKDMFKLMLGQNDSQWLPSVEAVREMCVGYDHSRKTQHPDRCEKCDEVFDEDKARKALYNPFKAATRAAAWCAPCVDTHKGVAPLWRM